MQRCQVNIIQILILHMLPYKNQYQPSLGGISSRWVIPLMADGLF